MSEKNKFDLWLERLSYIAQVGLFSVTIFTIYYTVIPLYQNAALQESIAMKEQQLKELKDKYYEKNRGEAMRSFLSHATLDCTTLLQPIVIPLPPVEGEIPNYEMTKLKKDIYACINEPKALVIIESQLSNVDVAIFKNALDKVNFNASELKKRYISYFNEHKDVVDKLSKKSPPNLNNSEEGMLAAIEIQEKALRLERIEYEYEDMVRKEVYKLGDIQWPVLKAFQKPSTPE